MKESPRRGSRFSRAMEMAPFSPQQVALRALDMPPGDCGSWKPYMLPQVREPRRLRRGGIAVGPFAARLIQREKARGCPAVMGPGAQALEEAARRWEGLQAAGKAGR